MSLVQEVAAEVFLLTVPVQVIMKDVNVYIFRGEVPTLLDVGTNTPEAARAIDEALAYLGISVPAQVLISHWHVDHSGGAARLQQQGTDIIVGRKDYHEWSTFLEPESFAQIQKRICEEWGVPEKESYMLNSIYSGINRFTQLPQQVKFTGHEETLQAGDMSLRVLESPGHSSGHLCFFNEESGLLFTGDQLLPNQIAYPGVWLEDSQVVSGSIPYLRSLEELANLKALNYFPGHGSPQPDPSRRCHEVYQQIMAQSRSYVAEENVYTSALNLSKDKPTPDRLFFNLHLVAGWEELARVGE